MLTACTQQETESYLPNKRILLYHVLYFQGVLSNFYIMVTISKWAYSTAFDTFDVGDEDEDTDMKDEKKMIE